MRGLAHHDDRARETPLGLVCAREGNSEREAGTDAGRAVHEQQTTHQIGELTRDGEPEAGAAVAPRGRPVDLGKPLENKLLGAQRDADPGILHVDAQHHLVRLDCFGEHRDRDTARVGELDRVSDQIDQDLLQRARRAIEAVRHGRIDGQAQFQTFVACLVMQQRTHRRKQGMQIEGRGLHRHRAGFDLGHVQKIADHLQQRLPGAANRADHVLLLGAQRARPEADPPCR